MSGKAYETFTRQFNRSLTSTVLQFDRSTGSTISTPVINMAKRKAEAVIEEAKETKKPVKTSPTTQVSLCIPSTAISGRNARNLEQITQIAYQIAKASTIYNVVEIVVLDIPEAQQEAAEKPLEMSGNKGGKKIKFNFSDEDILAESAPAPVEAVSEELEKSDSNSYLLASLLQFFVTPPYLVKSIFSPIHNVNNKTILKKLQYAQKLPKITTLPFMSNNDVYKDFKEGLAIAKETPKVVNKKDKSKKIKATTKIGVTRYVNIGEAEPLELKTKREIPVNSRVTVDLKNKTIVSPLEAYGVSGNKSSFGYYIRMCKKFNAVFTESSVPEGYSASYYVNCDDFHTSNSKIQDYVKIPKVDQIPSTESHILLILGNYRDLELSFNADKVNLAGVENVGQMFDGQLSIPQGVRVEDGSLIALSKFA
jgi:predicted SPOUT superfamily RNA methylase MTH1